MTDETGSKAVGTMEGGLIIQHAKRYQCPSCRKSWSKRSVASGHLAVCQHDPANRTCKTCEHYWPETGRHSSDPLEYEPEGCGVDIEISLARPINCATWTAKFPVTDGGE